MALVLAASLVGCSSGTQTKGVARAVERPTPTPSPEPPTPTPTPVDPVVGTLAVDVVDGSRPTRLGFADDPDPDEAAARAIATRIASAIDRHLTALQDGGEDLAGLAALWVTSDDDTLATLTTALATPEVPVATATHDVTVVFEAAPTVAIVTTTVRRADDTSVAVELVFDVTGPRPLLQLVGEAAAPTDPTQDAP